jgi:hypothetical protein
MKKLLLVLFTLFTVQLTMGQDFFKPLPKPYGYVKGWYNQIPKLNPDAVKLSPVSPIHMSAWRPVATLPVLRYQDGQFSTTTIGGGVAWQYLEFNDSTGKWSSVISISPLTVLTGVNAAGKAFSLSYASTIGFFNNLLLVGGGYDITAGKPFALVSIGVNFNN